MLALGCDRFVANRSGDTAYQVRAGHKGPTPSPCLTRLLWFSLCVCGFCQVALVFQNKDLADMIQGFRPEDVVGACAPSYTAGVLGPCCAQV